MVLVGLQGFWAELFYGGIGPVLSAPEPKRYSSASATQIFLFPIWVLRYPSIKVIPISHLNLSK
mgnify:CR=1 FL=1